MYHMRERYFLLLRVVMFRLLFAERRGFQIVIVRIALKLYCTNCIIFINFVRCPFVKRRPATRWLLSCRALNASILKITILHNYVQCLFAWRSSTLRYTVNYLHAVKPLPLWRAYAARVLLYYLCSPYVCANKRIIRVDELRWITITLTGKQNNILRPLCILMAILFWRSISRNTQRIHLRDANLRSW